MILDKKYQIGKHSWKKKEPKPKLFGPDIFGWGGGLPREWVGAKKFGMSLETREIKLFWRDIPGFCRDIPAVPEKFEQKKFVFKFRPLNIGLAKPRFRYTPENVFRKESRKSGQERVQNVLGGPRAEVLRECFAPVKPQIAPVQHRGYTGAKHEDICSGTPSTFCTLP